MNHYIIYSLKLFGLNVYRLFNASSLSSFKKRLDYPAGNCLFDFRDLFETLLQLFLIAEKSSNLLRL